MTNSETYHGSVEYTLKKTAESAAIVQKGVEPLVERSLDIAVMTFMHAISSHTGLQRFFLPLIGRMYAEARERYDERLHKYSRGVIL